MIKKMPNRLSAIDIGDCVENAVRLLNAGTPMVVFDLETTGINTETCRILSFTAQKFVVEEGIYVRKDRLKLWMNPEMHIPEEATNVNHITDEMVADKPTEKECIQDILDFLGKSPFLCGFNSEKYDINVLNATLKRCGKKELTPILHVDVYKMAKQVLDLKKYNLEEVSHALGCDIGIPFHTSEGDVLATFRSFTVMAHEYKFDKPKGICPEVLDVNYWEGYNHRLRRVYVKTNPYAKCFYDIYNKEWRSDMAEIDLDALKQETFRFLNVQTESEMVAAVKG